MRTFARNASITALALGLLALFFRNAHLDQVWGEITRAEVWLLIVALGTMLLNLVLRAVRWQYLLAPVGQVRFRNAFRTTAIGFAASFVLPVRAGEVLRPYLLARREGFSATAAFATIVIERFIDTVTVVLLLGAVVLLFDPGVAVQGRAIYRAVQIGAAAVGGVALAGLGVMFVAAGRGGALAGAAMELERILPGGIAHKLASFVRMFAEGLAIVREPRVLLVALALSVPLWLSIGVGIWAVAVAFHIDVPFSGSFLLVALLVVGVAVPTPGGVGGFHEAFRLGATAFYGTPNDRAVGAALVLHAMSFLPATALGLWFVMQDGLNLTGMRKLASLAATEGESGEVPVLRSSGR